MFHNTEKTETPHGNAPQILFVARTTTPKSLKEAGFVFLFTNCVYCFRFKLSCADTTKQIANHCQLSCCIIKFCYTWVNKCDVTRLRHKYQWSVEILAWFHRPSTSKRFYTRSAHGASHHAWAPGPPPSKSGAGFLAIPVATLSCLISEPCLSLTLSGCSSPQIFLSEYPVYAINRTMFSHVNGFVLRFWNRMRKRGYSISTIYN